MSKVCLYFQLHQPYRLANFDVFDVGIGSDYFKGQQQPNKEIFQKVARKSYLPMLGLLRQLVRENPDFFVTFSCSGIFLEQAESYQPRVISLLKDLVSSGQVELLSETYHHSLASLYSKEEFFKQVRLHQQKIEALFDYTPQVFRNTELIFSNQIAQLVTQLGYKGMLTEGVDRYLEGKSRTQVFLDKSGRLKLLLKHAQLSDDIAFRFSDKNWSDFPLHSDRYLEWLNQFGDQDIINLFMDFETFGEHQWQETGIFKFFRNLVKEFAKGKTNNFVTPGQIFEHSSRELPKYDVPEPISWADIDRDLTAWIDNPLQQDTLNKIYELESLIVGQADDGLLENWRRLQTSDHFYYMCTKWAADGDVHAYFSPYDSPYEAYRKYSIVLADIKEKLL